MASIAANLDDVQACAEASSRTVDLLQRVAAGLDGRMDAPHVRSVIHHIEELQTCARSQREALRELRTSLALLGDEMGLSGKGVTPPAPRSSMVRRGH